MQFRARGLIRARQWSHDGYKAEVERVRRSLNVIADRVYIADDMRNLNLFSRWKEAIILFRKDRNYLVFEKTFCGRGLELAILTK